MNVRQEVDPEGDNRERANLTLVLRAALLAAWIGCLLWLSLASKLPSVPSILAWDKLQHAVAHAILTLLAGRFFTSLWRSDRLGWWSGFSLSVVFGLFIEWAQGALTRHRHADWHDVLANLVGAGCVLVVALMLTRKVRQSTSKILS